MAKARDAGYIPGQHWVVCDRCEESYREKDMRKEWNGLIVCKWCYEPRHPQDFVRASKDQIAAKGLVRPEREDTFVEVTGATEPDPIPPGTFDNSL